MLFVRHATTPGMRTACFPSDEEADPAGLAKAGALRSTATFMAVSAVWAAPARAALQTARAMGLPSREAAALAEADCGRWRGLSFDRVAREEPEALACWLTEPGAAPHGGESRAAHAVRVANWLDSVRDEPDQVAVCEVGTIRAALAHALRLDPLGAARFDVAPLSTTELVVARDGWRIVHVNRKV
ncbi:histidine phosphatase family protein [Nonomuraea spiralis]|uniref:histidine phosphatase family protein n=1 Tax=Nonomuraea spiralis TaxID=46182 RepID=UPI00379EEA40